MLRAFSRAPSCKAMSLLRGSLHVLRVRLRPSPQSIPGYGREQLTLPVGARQLHELPEPAKA